MATEAEITAGPEALSLADRWIRSRLDAAILAVRDGYAQYRFDLAAQAAYEFTWYEFCDWYLEFSKPVLQSTDSSPEELRGTRRTLIAVLEALLRLLHPLMPFITEEIWQRVGPRAGKTGDSIMRQPYPSAEPGATDPLLDAEMRWVMDFILGIRRIRGELDIAPSLRLSVLLKDASAQDLARSESNAGAIHRLAGVDGLRPLGENEPVPQSAAAVLGDMQILVPMAGLVDVEAELERLGKRRSKLEQELARASAKLGNENFVRNAPAEVVAQEQARVEEFKRELAQLADQLKRVASL